MSLKLQVGETLAIRKVAGPGCYELAIPLNVKVDIDPIRRLVEGEKALSNRENEVLGLIGDGLTSQEIGLRLFISQRSVQSHYYNIRHKLGLANVNQVIVYAARRDQKIIGP
jgi:DNA-binding CsgD family transcriptional regulator